MMSVPGFQRRGGGISLSSFHYKPEDVDCQYCLHYWFFGHYHDNRIIDDRYILQWEQISGLEI